MELLRSTQFAPVIWLVLGIALAITEGLTVQLTVIWYAIGAACAAVSALLGLGFWGQVAVFLGVSGLLLICTRPFVKKVLTVKKQSTNADRVIGEVGVVRETIDNDLGLGRVAVLGMDWSARALGRKNISAGEKVTVLAIQGVTVIVELYTNPSEGKNEGGYQ